MDLLKIFVTLFLIFWRFYPYHTIETTFMEYGKWHNLINGIRVSPDVFVILKPLCLATPQW